MVDFNESEGESAFLVVRSSKGVWFDNPHVFHRSLAKVPISFCFAEGAQVQTELGPTASVKVGGYFASSADYEEWYQRRRASLTLPPLLGAEACGVKNDVVVKEEAAAEEAASEEPVVAEESSTKSAATEEAAVAEEAASEEATIKPAAAEVSASQEAPVAEAPVAEEAVAEEAAKEVEKPAKTVSNTPDPTEWADRSMVVEDSFYASKPVFLTSVEIGLAEPPAAKIMQRVSRGLLARKKVAVKEEAATEEAATEEAATEECAAEEAAAKSAAAEESAIKPAAAEVSASQEAPVAEAPVAVEAVAE